MKVLQTSIRILVTVFFGLLSSSCKTEPESSQAAVLKQTVNSEKPEVLTIYAAAGTRPVTTEICDLFEKDKNVVVEKNFASSGTLARQIASGASVDLFVSANKQWIDFLKEKNLLKDDTIKTIAGNSLVFIAPKGSNPVTLEFTEDFNIASAAENIAVGDPAYVPVGKYTHAVFKKLQWSDKLEGKLVLAKDVSSVLHYVELKECNLGVVYKSEALCSKKVNIVADVPEELHAPIVFYIAELKNSSSSKTSHQLSEMFVNRGKEIFVKYGFKPSAQ
ncbi:MAG: molybdate ABC transporter substrate-binding protein [Deltaproteobacteria bacterium]|nr:molybdate ABC transporter substrate-binding protein [Deltaproteobacteria bacterium]